MTLFRPLFTLTLCTCILSQSCARARSITRTPVSHFTNFAARYKTYVETGRLPEDRCIVSETPLLKVFIYPLPTTYTFYASIGSGEDAEDWESMYMSEFIFYERLLSSCFAVEASDARDADLYFVPAMVAWHMHRGRPDVGFAGGHSFLDAALAYIRKEYPFWEVNSGADHVWLIAHDIGSCLGPTALHNSVFLQPYGQREHFDVEAMLREDKGFVESESFIKRIQHPCYAPSKDTVIPPYIGSPDVIANAVQGSYRLKRGPRKVHAYFRGSVSGNSDSEVYSGGVRQWLFNERVYLNERFGFEIHGKHLQSTEAYFVEMAQATFCISPAGWVSWSPRIFQAIAVQCIPVLIGPRSDLPFAGLEWFDHAKFTIRFDRPIAELPEYLASIPTDTIVSMQTHLAAVWRRFTYKSSEGKGVYGFHREGPDAFDMTMDILRESYGRSQSQGFSLEDKLHLDMSQTCVLIPGSNGYNTNVEITVPLSDVALSTTAQAHVNAFGGVTEIVEEHLKRQLDLSRYRRLEGRNYMEASPDVSCFIFHRLCHTKTKRMGNCIMYGRQAFDLFSSDVDFYGATFFDRAQKLVINAWPTDEDHGLKSARSLYNKTKDLSQVFGCFGNMDTTAVSHLRKAGFCQIHMDEKRLQEDLAVVVALNLNCSKVFKLMKCAEPCLANPSMLKGVHVVNLARREDKWKVFLEHYKERNIGLPVERHEAVDGLRMSLTSSVKRLFDILRSVVQNPYEDHAFRRGVLGCALSHLQLWTMLEQEGTSDDDVILVLEDDAEFTPEFKDKWESLVSVAMIDSSWDILYLGFSDFQDLYDDVYVHEGIRSFSTLSRNHGGGTFAYMIRRKGAHTLLQRARRFGVRQPIDWFMIDAFRAGAIKAYLADPAIVVSTPVQSEDSNTHELYPLRLLPLICSRRQRVDLNDEDLLKQIARVEIQRPTNGSRVSSDGILRTRVVVSEGVDVQKLQADLECYRLCVEVMFRNKTKASSCMLLWEEDDLRLQPGWFNDATLPMEVTLQPALYSISDKMLQLPHVSLAQVTVVAPMDIVVRLTDTTITLMAPDLNEFAASHASSLLCFAHTDGNTCISIATVPRRVVLTGLRRVTCWEVTGRELARAEVQSSGEERFSWRIILNA